MSWRRLLTATFAVGVTALTFGAPAWSQQDPGDSGQVQTPPQPTPTPPTTGFITPTTLPGGVTTTTQLGVTTTTQVGATTSTTRATTATPTSSSATVSPASASPGASVTVTGSGFAPSQPVSLTFDATPLPQSVTANQAGAVSIPVTIPTGTTAGQHRIVMTGRNPSGGQHQAMGAVTVALAQTGAAENIAMAVAAVLLIALGYHLLEKGRWSSPVSTMGWRGR